MRYLWKAKFNWPLRLILPLLTLSFGAGCCAFEWPLSPEAVREAYFFGRGSDRAKVAELLGQYIRLFQPKDRKSFAGSIELHTPYQRVLQRSWETTSIYSAQQAQIDYASRSDIVEVQVFIYPFAGRSAPSDMYSDSHGQVLDRRENFWREYQFRITQAHVIEPKKILGKPIYGGRGNGLTGAEVNLELDASEITSGELVIQVISPDQQITTTHFDLDRLK